MNRALTYIISIVAMIFFAYITTYFQQYVSMIFIGYFVLMMIIMMIAAGRSASKILEEINYIQEGEKIITISKETINKIKEKDPLVFEEEKSQYYTSLITMIPLLAIMVILFFKGVREGILNEVRSFVGNFVTDEQFALFASWLVFYFMFFIIAQGSYFIGRLYSKVKKTVPLTVAASYTITDKGLIIDNRLPLKFPLKNAKIFLNTKRKFVEIEVKGLKIAAPGGQQQTSKIRLYSHNPKEVYEILKNNIERED